MTEPTLDERIDAAAAYERLHVPALFGQWASRVLDEVGLLQGERLLDVACGTGVCAREAVTRAGPDGFVAGVDPDPGMLAVAAGMEPRVAWRQATADSIPFPDQAFDRVVSQFGLMFFPDRIASLREMLRVLAPGGRMTVAVWDSLDHSAAYPLEVDLLHRVAGSRAADALRAPFVLGDPGDVKRLLEEAGAGSVTIRTVTGTARFPGIRPMIEADLRGWLPVMGVTLEEDSIARILREAETVLHQYVMEDGRVVFDSPAHLVTGVRGS